MASKSFAINETPHEAIIGSVKLQLQPEVVGAVFAQAYAPLKETQMRVKAAGDDVDADALADLDASMRQFIATFLLPDSQDDFDDMVIPTRVLVQLLEYVAGLYGGGAGGNDPGTSSTGS